MEKDKKYKQNCEVCSQMIEVDDCKQGECPVCNYAIFMDFNGNGDKCPNCSWVKNALSKEYPDRVICSNLISLNKARRLYKECKPFHRILMILLMDIIFTEKWNLHIKAKHMV